MRRKTIVFVPFETQPPIWCTNSPLITNRKRKTNLMSFQFVLLQIQKIRETEHSNITVRRKANYFDDCLRLKWEHSDHFCSDPTCGGRNYILKWVFFVPWILADRYIHCREVWVVSLKSSFSVNFEIKKIFFIFVFFEELSRIEILCEHRIFGMILFTFSVTFLKIIIFLLQN